MNKDLMKNFIGNLDFGPIKGNQFKLAMTGGIAIRKVTANCDEQWLVYDKASKSVTNVGSMSFKASGMLWKVPVNNVVAGDLILNDGQPCYILSTTPNNAQVTVYGISENRESTFSPIRQMYNMPVFFTKVTNVMEGGNPFGGITGQPQNNASPINPMIMAMMDGDFNMKDMAKLQMLGGMGSGGINPMAMMFLNKMDGDDNDSDGKDSMSSMMEMMMMQNMVGGNAQANPMGNMFNMFNQAAPVTPTATPEGTPPEGE